jgi:hypothetical protein
LKPENSDPPILEALKKQEISRSSLRWRSVLRYYIDLSRVVSNDEAYCIIQRLIADERSHHEMLDKLMSDLKELYGEQLALESSIDIVSPTRLIIYTPS